MDSVSGPLATPDDLKVRPVPADPGAASVQHYLMYGLSIPERALRCTTLLVGGALQESSTLLVPRAFRNSRTYSTFVQQMLDFMVHNVGGREASGDSTTQIENFVARKAVGNFIEMAAWTVLPLSPLTVLAVVSDVAYGSQVYLKELADELKREGIIDPQSSIDNATDLLGALERASAVASKTLDTPPLSVEGLQGTIEQVRAAAASVEANRLLPQAEIDRLWNEMHQLASREGVGVMEISTTMALHAAGRIGTLSRGALSTITVAGNMFRRDIFGHYELGLQEIRTRGFYATLAAVSQPYVEAIWRNFAATQSTWTGEFFSGRLLRRWLRSLKQWFLGN